MGFKRRPKDFPAHRPEPVPRIARSTDAYSWLEVKVRRVDDELVNITLVANNQVFPEVLWHWGEHFDPDYIWASYYPEEGTGYAGGFVGCPRRTDKKERTGCLLVNRNLPGVADAEERQRKAAPTLMSPKWPRSSG